MRRLIAIFILLVAAPTSCSRAHFSRHPKPAIEIPGPPPGYVNHEEVSRIVLTMASKLNYEKHLVLEDSTVYFEKKINRIRLDFSSMDTIEIWEARGLLVDLVEEFLGRINSNAQVYPHLGKTPFTADDLEVYITFVSYYNSYVDLQTIGLVTLRKGLAHYVASDAIDCFTPCWHKRTETYVQSRNFIQFHREGELLYKPKPAVKKGYFGDERLYEGDIVD